MPLLKIYGATPEQLILRLEIDKEADGRWIAEAIDLPSVMCIQEEFRLVAPLFQRVERSTAVPFQTATTSPVSASRTVNVFTPVCSKHREARAATARS